LQLTEITREQQDAFNTTHFVVFDAYRNALKLNQPGSPTLVQSKGFTPGGQESGTLIAYATAECELATDEGPGSGQYARVRAEEIVRPGIEAVAMFPIVRAVPPKEPDLVGTRPNRDASPRHTHLLAAGPA